MIQITDRAKQNIEKLLSDNKIISWGIVLSVSDIHCAGMHYDIDFREKVLGNECEFIVNGVRLFIDEKQTGFFEEVTLDWNEEGVSQGLVIINSIEQSIEPKACGSIHGCHCSAKTKIEGMIDCIKC
jgi:iron-sulfur cluster assembly accessory protein